jgi:thiol:disulfide interchange protein
MSVKFLIVPVSVLLSLLIAPPIQAAAQMTQPFLRKHLYDADANPRADIAAALKQAKAQKKRVILDFGGDWCGDCLVLDMYMHQSPNGELLNRHYIVVHIDIGHMDRNVDVARKYKVPITKGVPALAVLDADGKLLYSQEDKEFESATPSHITAFLYRWKA